MVPGIDILCKFHILKAYFPVKLVLIERELGHAPTIEIFQKSSIFHFRFKFKFDTKSSSICSRTVLVKTQVGLPFFLEV